MVLDRSLLFLEQAEAGDNHALLDEIRAQDWELLLAHSEHEISRLLSRGHCRVGMACLDETTLDDAGRIAAMYPQLEWIALLDSDTLASSKARELVGAHFYDYHTLPVDASRLLVTLGHAWGMAEIRALKGPEAQVDRRYQMVGRSEAMQIVFSLIARVARTDVPVLITGQTGTGKEMIAEAIHCNSARFNEPFKAVNCGALAPGIVQSELFGHEKGAFTGAHRQRIGHIEAANAGTVFLDEIGDLPQELQTNLLRFLERRLITRVGGTESFPVDVRIIAATHVDLSRAVNEGRFREDLYYRLNVFPLSVPSLAQRGQDIELLAHHFFNKFIEDRSRQVTGFSPDAIKAMYAHGWPGNIRELMNRVRRALVTCEHRRIRAQDLGFEGEPTAHGKARTLQAAREDAERETVEDALRHARDNVSHAARKLGVSRVTMYRLMRKHAIYVD